MTVSDIARLDQMPAAADRTEVVIRLENVGVRYRSKKAGPFSRAGVWALKDVTLEVYRGETLGIIGRNGVGKSTLLMVLAGVIDADRGTVRRGDLDAAILSPQSGFQRYLTGRENIMLNGMLRGFPAAEIRARMPDIIEFSELGDKIDEPIFTYSAGMRSRLGFSATVHLVPDVLLMDEVLSAGDRSFRQKAATTIRDLITSKHRTVVLVSHNPATHRKLCDRVIWIDKGATRMEGSPKEVLAAYEEETGPATDLVDESFS